ncbi:alpha/beta fold hydrolase [Tropicibacter sp. R16_0]|uniref:alpha/beta fold hydrolase n=1 Tax=Tropicibacter sp. R16_0 TaxID=2821102 RepID=UPI001AD98FBF|nr:alpha/beta hydrolase [Tropicibacter sp. R16_0]MBO9451257.1 alpha/beta fold hydrolase [Tropicibacter sp. R16_0]
MPTINFRGEDIEYLDQGQGPALVLIPGLGGRLAFWKEIVPGLSASFRVLSLDHPMTVTQQDAIQAMADLVLTLLDHLNVPRCSIVGQSMGGPVVQQLALSHPDRLDRIVFGSTWAGPDDYFRRAFGLRLEILGNLGVEGYAKAQILSTFSPEDIAANPERASEWEERTIASSDATVLTHRMRAILAYSASDRMREITHPCLVIAVEGDQVVPPHMSRHLAELLPNAELKELSGGGHFKAMLDPLGYLAALEPFLKS